MSNSLPSFTGRRDFAEKEKLGRGRWYPGHGRRTGRLITFLASIARRFRLRLLLVIAFVLALSLFYISRKISHGFPYSQSTDRRWQLCITSIGEHLSLAAEANLSSFWPQIKEAESWNGKVHGNGQLKETA